MPDREARHALFRAFHIHCTKVQWPCVAGFGSVNDGDFSNDN